MSEWIALQDYAAAFEADFHRSLLETAGVPVLVKGPQTGIFGPGFAGATAYGVTLFVPTDRAAEARELLGEEGDDS